MPAAELQPRLRPRSRTAADQRVGVMRLYYTGASPENLKRARQHAPSHSHGYGWTPAKMTPHDAPYFLDNGAFTDHFDADAWVETVERALIEMPRSPDFLVLPTCTAPPRRQSSDTESGCTIARWASAPGSVCATGCSSPACPFPSSSRRSKAVKASSWAGRRGGSERTPRRLSDSPTNTTSGRTSVARRRERSRMAYRQGFDSADTTTVFQNQYWHYLDRLEEATAETQPIEPERAAEQASIDGWA